VDTKEAGNVGEVLDRGLKSLPASGATVWECHVCQRGIEVGTLLELCGRISISVSSVVSLGRSRTYASTVTAIVAHPYLVPRDGVVCAY
jgi:hypothetical protein